MRSMLIAVLMLLSTIDVWHPSGASARQRGNGAATPTTELVARRSTDAGSVTVELDVEAVRAASRHGGATTIRALPLGQETSVDVDLEPFTVTRPDTRFVLGHRGRADEVLDFDPSSVAVLRGTVRGRPGSHVFLASTPRGLRGTVALGAGGLRYGISSWTPDGRHLGADRAAVTEAGGGMALPPGVPPCAVHEYAGADAGIAPAAATFAEAVALPQRGLKQLELAVETDHEYFALFDDAAEAAAYLMTLYAEVGDIFARDVGVRVDLVFTRLWPDPDDPFDDAADPLHQFQTIWNTTMGAVHRDTAQLVSGRRDYPFGGQAFLPGLCSAGSYSVTGYILGFHPTSVPSAYEYDVGVTAHELGHNTGALHDHDPPNYIDHCDVPTTNPQRGTIMSYCAQTWSGGNANQDLYFHTLTVADMKAGLAAGSCIATDCDGDGVDDAAEIAGGSSPDANANGVPDDCEDCNRNGTRDDLDIAGNASGDVDMNGVPDECQPDCNGNFTPDERDVALGTGADAYGNRVLDECETDCNDNGISDYTEIQLAMTLDTDRNAVLDACQDCDGDGTVDRVELDHAHSLWLASGLPAMPLRELDAGVGVVVATSGAGPGALVNEGQDVLVAPDGSVLVSSGADDRVMRFDRNGSYLGDFVSPGSGGLARPAGLAFAPDGRLLVASRDTDRVLAYDGASGAPLGTFATGGGLVAPFGITYGPDGSLYVTSNDGRVLVYDGTTGTFAHEFVHASDNGGLAEPRGITFKGDGDLLIASFGTNEVLAFDGATGAALGKWAQVGTPTILNQVSPWGVRVGPNGNVFVVRTGDSYGSGGGGDDDDHDHGDVVAGLHFTNAQVYEFDRRNGLFVRAFVMGNDQSVGFPTGLAFAPGWSRDCNQDRLQDECDVAAGTSQDTNSDLVPDECQVDCNANDVQDRLDVIPYGKSYDRDHDLVPDECELCAPTPTPTCVPAEAGRVKYDAARPGREKLAVKLAKLGALTQGDFGNPIFGSTGFGLCFYDGAQALVREMTVARAGRSCGSRPCWTSFGSTGYRYRDTATSADGVQTLVAKSGLAGRGKLTAKGKNVATSGRLFLPTDVASVLAGSTSATVQVMTTDAGCVSVTLPRVQRADGVAFRASRP